MSIAYENEGSKTMYDKIWADHVVTESEDGTCTFYIDRHLVHEVHSPYTNTLPIANPVVAR